MSLKITIPKPCHENWDGMTPDEKGRFCSLCAKSVVDFTAMPRTEVESYLIANSDKKVCGRFSIGQIENAPVTLHIPREALYRQTSFRNVFLLALVISMGTTLFSCQKRTIGEIAVAEDTIQADTALKNTGVQNTAAIDSTLVKDSLRITFKPLTGKVCIKKEDSVAPQLPKDLIVGDIAFTPETTRVEKDVYNPGETDIMPQFPGGINKLYEYINSKHKAPKGIDGNRKIIVNFIIEKDGSLGTIKVLRGFDESENAEIVDILKNSPKWIPAQIGNENVRVLYTLPIVIKSKE